MRRSVFRSEEGRRAIQSYYRGILEKAPFPLRSRFVPTACGRTHIIESGAEDAPTLLLLHGTASNSASWFGDIPRWSEYFHVIAADQPGEPGLSDTHRMTLASEEASVWVSSLLDAVNTNTACIAGMSLGGWIALHFATRHPERLDALALLAASGLAPARRSFLLKALPLLLLGDWGSKRINRLVYHQTDVPAAVLEFGRLVSRHFRPVIEPVPVFCDIELRRLRMPVMYVGGTHDALVRTHASARRLVDLIPHASAILLPDCGHAVLGQTERILSFLRLRSTGTAGEEGLPQRTSPEAMIADRSPAPPGWSLPV